MTANCKASSWPIWWCNILISLLAIDFWFFFALCKMSKFKSYLYTSVKKCKIKRLVKKHSKDDATTPPQPSNHPINSPWIKLSPIQHLFLSEKQFHLDMRNNMKEKTIQLQLPVTLHCIKKYSMCEMLNGKRCPSSIFTLKKHTEQYENAFSMN